MQINNLAAAARHHQDQLLREAQQDHRAREARAALATREGNRAAARERILASLTARVRAIHAAAEPRLDPIEAARRQGA